MNDQIPSLTTQSDINKNTTKVTYCTEYTTAFIKYSLHPPKPHRHSHVKANVLMHGCRLSRVEGQVPYYGGKQK